jgi:murein DD-endopeptidase MepM/ murein hydrolase activator NlpD
MNAVWIDHASVLVDLGDEPPLVTSDNRSGPPDRRRVSLRWLTGTVLAALASTSLMGGALYVALDGQQSLARPIDELPTFSGEAGINQPVDFVAKSDLLTSDQVNLPNRQILKVSTITRSGERALIRLRPFARVSAPLIANASELVDEIPPYDPLRIFADANVETPSAAEDTLYGANVDGDMALKEVDFPVDSTTMEPFVELDGAATEQLVREAAPFMGGQAVSVASLSFAAPSRIDAGFAQAPSLKDYGVSITAANVSFIPTTPISETPEPLAYAEEKAVTADAGATIEQLLTDNEATDDESVEIANLFREKLKLKALRPGDRLRIALAPDTSSEAGGESGRYRPVRVSIYRDDVHLGTVELSDATGYEVAAEPRSGTDKLFGTDTADIDDSPRPRLYESLYETALSNGMSPDLIDELVRIYSFDLDLYTRVQPGDAIEVVYSLDEDEAETAEASEIVYSSIKLGRKERGFYRYKAPDDGSVDYYDSEGKSAKKFLLPKPMSGGTFRSGFGSRKHPLLGYTRAHTGVDWAAPRGTPIMAAGDGVITYADWKSGYGNYIEIQHTNGYASAYAHQTGFAPGIKRGISVRQGQIIGYVGSTGLSTGPHLHYEVHINNTPVDPMRTKLPRGRVLKGEILASFETERARIDSLLGESAAKYAAAADNSGG